jgi:hypothetical protein
VIVVGTDGAVVDEGLVLAFLEVVVVLTAFLLIL